jgi:hypothetical protein
LASTATTATSPATIGGNGEPTTRLRTRAAASIALDGETICTTAGIKCYAEPDNDLEWVCADHHAEITKYGSIQPATVRQREILRGHRYAEEYVARISFGTAFELIGAIARGEERSPA